MVSRKLVKQGAATLMISLPSKWIKTNKLDKGDEVEMEERGKDLVISTENMAQKSKKVLDITGFSPLVNRILIFEYVKGYDELEVKFKDSQEIKDFQKRVINELLGFEIVRQTQTSLFIKDITGAENQDIDELVKRIFFILDSMVDELIIALEKNQDLDPIIDTDIAVNKFVHFCLRMLNKKGYNIPEKTISIYSIVSNLEDIGDCYKRLAKDFKKIKPTKEYLNILREIKGQLSLFKDLIYGYDKKKLIKYAQDYERIKENIKKIKSKTVIDFHLFETNEILIGLNNHLLSMLDVASLV
ncbi:Uncharacterised protein [uncultured archaeon]|nr:Uncharacterised protein [uncultured archaeon]